MKFATKPIRYYQLTLGMLLHYLRKFTIQIFCKYLADMEENARQVAFLSPLALLLIHKF